MIFNAGGYFFIYCQLENHFKMYAADEIKNYIPVESIEQIKIINNACFDVYGRDVEWLNESELTYSGKMYDIIKQETRNDTTILYCLNDEKEDILNKVFAEIINNKKDINSFSSIANIIKILITIAVQPEISEFNYFQSYNDFLNLYISNLRNIWLKIPSPPPKNIS